MSGELRAILFDFNGVIIDDEPLHLELFRAVLARDGIALTEAEYQARYLGLDDRAAFAAALRDAGRPAAAEDVAALVARKAALYLDAIEGRDLLFPGMAEWVRELAADFPLGIASGALRQEIERALARSGLRACFSAVVAAEDVAVCKPDPEGYRAVLAGLNRAHAADIPPAACLVIEDSLPGIEAARRAGMRCLAVANSHPADRLRHADAVVARLPICDLAAMFRHLPPRLA